MSSRRRKPLARPHLRLIELIGIIVPRRLRSDWRQEWEAELRCREAQLADWDRLDWRHRIDLFRRSTSAFRDALWLQPRRLEDEMFQDVRYGARMLRQNPAFTVVLVATLALGIGANAALFSVVNGVLLNPLPYPEPDQLVRLHQSKPNFEAGAIPYPNFRDWQRENQTFSAMAIARGTGFSLTGTGEPERLDGRFTSADFFSVLGVVPRMGRTFQPGEDQRGAGPVVVISSGLWERRFGAARDVLGKGLTLDDKNYTIIGVLPPTFHLFRDVDVYVPIGQWNTPALQNRSAALGLHGIGRLKPGVSLAQAQADLDRVMKNLIAAYPDANRGNGAKLVPLKEELVGDVRHTLWTLFGAVGFVLLIACVNVSNLLLARSSGRNREFAVRAALGAGQWRLLRQSLTESVLLALLGGGLGLVLAGWATRAALGVLPTALPRAEEVGLDPRVLFFTLFISLLTGTVSGLAPALKISHRRLSDTLKEGGRMAGSRRHRAQGILVAVEMALALLLLIGGGLMIRSLASAWNVDPGFRPENVLSFELSFPPSMSAADEDTARASVRQLSDRLNAMPGARAASFSWGALPLQSEDDLFFWVDGRPKPASNSEMNMALVYRVESAYLAAMGIPLKKGRFFTDQDREQSPNVVVIDEVLARQYFANEDPIGRRLHMEDDEWQIVGVVGHVKQWGLDSDDGESLRAQIYEPFRQLQGSPSTVTVIVRADGIGATAGAALFDSIRQVVRDHNSQNVIFKAQTMNEVIAASLAARRFSMILLDAFAAMALLLASTGLYGVVSYVVGQRTHELGMRVALGARRSDVLRLVLIHGMKMALGGMLLGLVAALGLTRLIENMLYGVSSTDTATFAAVALVLISVSLLACLVPAWRATTVDPLVALRHE